MTVESSRRVGMVAAWEAIAQMVIDLRYIGVTLAYFNVIWFFCCLPLLTAPAATASLYVVTRKLTLREDVGWHDFLSGLKTYFFIGWRWALLNSIAAGIIFANLTFYSYMPPPMGVLLIALWVGLAGVWVIVQMYCFPIILEQESPNIRQAMRNAFVLTLRHPFFTFTYTLVAGFFIFISLIIPYLWAIVTAALLAFLYNGAVHYLVQIERGETPELEIESF